MGGKKGTEQEQKRSSSIFTLEVKNRVENFYDCCKIKSYLEALSAEAEAERVRRGWGELGNFFDMIWQPANGGLQLKRTPKLKKDLQKRLR